MKHGGMIFKTLAYLSACYFSIQYGTIFYKRFICNAAAVAAAAAGSNASPEPNETKMTTTKNKKKHLTSDHLFYDKARCIFLKSYNEPDHMHKYNMNIHPVFYSKTDYIEHMKDMDNDLEKEWKRRILMESTPHGNIIMYFDPFRRGFVYYSDETIQYSLLNAVVMKYVLLFRCRDFFLDDFIIPNEYPTQFYKIHDGETLENQVEKKDSLIKKGPFIKSKKSVNTGSVQTFLSKDVIRNKIIRIGCIANFSILSKPRFDIGKIKTASSDYTPISYKDFKSWRTPPSNMFD